MTSTMRAALLEAPGAPLVVRDVNIPQPGAGQLLVKLEACGVCHTDVHVWERGSADARAPMPLILGHEGIGRVAALGTGVEDWSIGARAGLAWIHDTCGHCRDCSEGFESFCQTQRAHGYTVHGGFAEYALADARFAARIDDAADPISSAPLMCAGLTAYGALETGCVDANTRCAVIGCGGLGMYAVQLAVRRRASVFVFDTSEDKLARAVGHGAKRGSTNEFKAGIDTVINFAPTPKTWPLMTELVRPRGMIVAAALVSDPVPLNQEWLTATGVSVTGTSVGTRRQMDDLLVIHRKAPLACETKSIKLKDVTQGLRDLRDGNVSGRLVIDFRS
jgi:alcohol dehydrogenase, propanol-preferring